MQRRSERTRPHIATTCNFRFSSSTASSRFHDCKVHVEWREAAILKRSFRLAIFEHKGMGTSQSKTPRVVSKTGVSRTIQLRRCDIFLDDITFTSAHNVLCENDVLPNAPPETPEPFRIDWGYSGEPYSQPEWRRGDQNAPVSHTGAERMTLSLTLTVRVRQGDPPRGRIFGEPVDEHGQVLDDPAFEFRSDECTLQSNANMKSQVQVVANGELPAWPQQIGRRIRWTFQTTDSERIPCGVSGPHTVFVTFDRPTIRENEEETYSDLDDDSPMEPLQYEDGATVVRMKKATEWVHQAGADSSVELIRKLFARFKGYVLRPQDLRGRQKEKYDTDPQLRSYLNKVDWPQFKHDAGGIVVSQKALAQGGAWPLAALEEFGAECQAIVRLIRGILMQLGHPGEVRTRYVSANATNPDVPVIHDRGIGCEGRTSDPNYHYTLVDKPVEVGRRYKEEDVRWNNYEAYLQYRYRGRDGEMYQAWYGGGEGLIDGPQREPLSNSFRRKLLSSVFTGLAEYRSVDEDGQSKHEITAYWSYC